MSFILVRCDPISPAANKPQTQCPNPNANQQRNQKPKPKPRPKPKRNLYRYHRGAEKTDWKSAHTNRKGLFYSPLRSWFLTLVLSFSATYLTDTFVKRASACRLFYFSSLSTPKFCIWYWNIYFENILFIPSMKILSYFYLITHSLTCERSELLEHFCDVFWFDLISLLLLD